LKRGKNYIYISNINTRFTIRVYLEYNYAWPFGLAYLTLRFVLGWPSYIQNTRNIIQSCRLFITKHIHCVFFNRLYYNVYNLLNVDINWLDINEAKVTQIVWRCLYGPLKGTNWFFSLNIDNDRNNFETSSDKISFDLTIYCILLTKQLHLNRITLYVSCTYSFLLHVYVVVMDIICKKVISRYQPTRLTSWNFESAMANNKQFI
jgi:hypothetical protein